MVIRKNDLVLWFCLLSIFEPDVFKSYAITDNIFMVMKLVTLAIVGVKYIKIVKKTIPKFSIWLLLYVAAIILVNCINNQPIFFVIKKFVECILACMLVEIIVYEDPVNGYKKMFNFFFVFFLINLLLMIPFPKGMVAENMESTNYKVYFLGIKNSMLNWSIIPCSLGAIINTLEQNRTFKTKYFIFLIICLVTIVYTRSSTGIVLFLLWFIYYLISPKLSFKFSLKKVMPLLVLIYIGVVFFRVLDKINPILLYLFGKDATFSGRTNLWATAINYFKERPIIGYGLREESIITFYGRSYTSHNLFLEILITGGIFLFCVWIFILLVLMKKNSLILNREIKNHTSMVFVLYFIACLFGGSIYQYRWMAMLDIIYISAYHFNKYHSSISD